MSDNPTPEEQRPDVQRDAIIRQRNRVVALILAGFVVLFFVITLVKFHP